MLDDAILSMNYQETIEYLYALQPPFHVVGAEAYKPGFDNILDLMAHLGNPHQKFRSVHIAGTNGKGSTSHLIASVLQTAGYKVGLYTSPHLVDYRERIKINATMVDEQYVVDFVEKNKQILEHIRPSFFETTTAMAFCYFALNRVDVAVVEVGLGGRLDSTNIITPDLSVITNIGLDHVQFLGNSLASIAGEKAGIIKPKVPIVIGETLPETTPVFLAKASQCNAPIVFAEQETIPDLPCELLGIYQQKNKRTAFVAIQQLIRNGYDISLSNIHDGFLHVCEQTGLQGRWQILGERPLIVCDTGHNSHGWNYVAKQLKQQACKKLYVVFGMVDDKDVQTVVELLPSDAYYILTQPNTHRALTVDILDHIFSNANLHHETIGNVVDAYKKATEYATADDMIFVGGSNYVVGEFLSWHKNCGKKCYEKE